MEGSLSSKQFDVLVQLTGAGKTTMGTMLYEYIRARKQAMVLLDDVYGTDLQCEGPEHPDVTANNEGATRPEDALAVIIFGLGLETLGGTED